MGVYEAGWTTRNSRIEGYAANHSQKRLNGVKDAFKIGMLPDFFIKNVLQNNEVVEVPSDGEIKGNYAGVIAMQYAQNKYMPSRLKVFTEFVTAHLMKGSFNERCL